MKLIVTYKGEKYEFGEPTLKDLVMLERQFGVGAQALTGESARMEYMLFLAYCALRRLGVVVGKYTDEFLDDIEDLNSVESEADATGEDPTGETPSQQPA